MEFRPPTRSRRKQHGHPAGFLVHTLVRQTEPDSVLRESLDLQTNTDPLAKSCDLEPRLHGAQARFLEALDGYTPARPPGPPSPP